jgi:hypothetical protein
MAMSKEIFNAMYESNTSVVNLTIKNIRPTFQNVKAWENDPQNVYIGIQKRINIGNNANKTFYYLKDSILSNPFKVSQSLSNNNSLKQYETNIRAKIDSDNEFKKYLISLKGKTLGCWYKYDKCHGHVLVSIIDELSSENDDSSSDDSSSDESSSDESSSDDSTNIPISQQLNILITDLNNIVFKLSTDTNNKIYELKNINTELMTQSVNKLISSTDSSNDSINTTVSQAMNESKKELNKTIYGLTTDTNDAIFKLRQQFNTKIINILKQFD